MAKGLHPELWHEEKNHNDVFKKIASPAGDAAVGAKVRSFRSATQPQHHEAPQIVATKAKPSGPALSIALAKTESEPKLPNATPLAAQTTKKHSHHRRDEARRRTNHADRHPGPPSTLCLTTHQPWR